MDKKYVPFVLGGIFIVFFGYLVYTEYMPKKNEGSEKKLDDDILGVKIKKDSFSDNRAEVYKNKWRKESVAKRKVDDSDDFFASEVKKKDSVIVEKKTDNFESEVHDKPKVVYKYIEKKEVAVKEPEPTIVEKPKRKKVGFATDQVIEASTSNTVSSIPDINIPVVIQEETSIKSGGTVMLRTVSPGVINGIAVPQNTFVPTIASVSNNRIMLTVTSFKVPSGYINVPLTAYSLDGGEGILVEGDVDQQIRKDITNDALSTATRSLNVPILRDIPVKASRKKMEDPSIPLRKGHELTLRKRQ